MPPAAASATFPVSRARVDRKRKVGLANAVAQGRFLYRVGIMSETELDTIRRLANADDGAYDAYRRQEDARRREASRARTAMWPDTIQAKQEAFLRRRRNDKEEEERRANIILELDEHQREEERQQRQAQLALKHMQEDPRGRNVHSVLLLHEAIKDREAQIAFKNELKRQGSVDEKEEREMFARELSELRQKEEEEKLARRSRNVEEKNDHLQQMLFQIAERKRIRAEKKSMLAEVKSAAAEEAEENAEEEREVRQKIAVVHEYNRSIAKPALTKHGRLRQRIEREADDDMLRAIQDKKVEALKRVPMERLRKKREWFETCKEHSRKAFETENEAMRHKERTQDVFEQRGTSLTAKMANDEERRKEEAQEERRRRRAEFLRANEDGFVEELPEGVRRAATHRAGFMTDEEARQYQKEMQAHPALVLEEQRAEAEKRREEAELLQRIHRLQADEKKENDRREAEELVEARRRREEAMEEDDERYRAYVKSQLPADMDPYLYAKAMNLHL